MKKIFLGLFIGLLVGGVGVWVVLHRSAGAEKEDKKEEKKEESRVSHGTNGETFLKLDREAQVHVGLKVASLEAAVMKPEVKAFGRVLDPSLLATAVSDLAGARAQRVASTREFDRLALLHSQNQNVSTRALEAAEATVVRDRIALDVAQTRFATSWGRSITERKDLEAFVRSLISQEAALVRIDVPPSEKLNGLPVAGRISLLATPEAPWAAEMVGAATSVDPQTLGRGFFLLLRTNSLAVNTVVTAWLSLPGEDETGVIVPREAVVRHEGEAFVYRQTGDEQFERKELELNHPLERGWFTEDLKPGTRVVVSGAQQLLSEELKGEGGGE